MTLTDPQRWLDRYMQKHHKDFVKNILDVWRREEFGDVDLFQVSKKGIFQYSGHKEGSYVTFPMPQTEKEFLALMKILDN